MMTPFVYIYSHLFVDRYIDVIHLLINYTIISNSAKRIHLLHEMAFIQFYL